jgi:hypothetical protein
MSIEPQAIQFLGGLPCQAKPSDGCDGLPSNIRIGIGQTSDQGRRRAVSGAADCP